MLEHGGYEGNYLYYRDSEDWQLSLFLENIQ